MVQVGTNLVDKSPSKTSTEVYNIHISPEAEPCLPGKKKTSPCRLVLMILLIVMMLASICMLGVFLFKLVSLWINIGDMVNDSGTGCWFKGKLLIGY